MWALREPGALVPYLRRKLGRKQRTDAVLDADGIADEAFYAPLFSPWLGHGSFPDDYAFAREHTLVTPDRCYTLLALARQASRLPGCWMECGVYRGGTAMMLARLMGATAPGAELHLFDTFSGMPETNPDEDLHRKGDFGDTTLGGVRKRVLAAAGTASNRVHLHAGFMPDTFADTGITAVALAHVDVDIYQSVWDCCEYIYPRLAPGGILLFDDYGLPTCPGARRAVDQFFEDKPETPLVLSTGQALVIRIP